MSAQDNDFFQQLLAAYHVEAAEHLQAMSDGLLQLEKCAEPSASQPILEGIFREIHSLKGASRAVNLTGVETLCQAIEDLFAAWKRQGRIPDVAEFDVAHRAVDAVGCLVVSDRPEAQENRQGQLDAILQQLGQLRRAEVAAEPKPPLEHNSPLPYTGEGQGVGEDATKSEGSFGKSSQPAPTAPSAKPFEEVAPAPVADRLSMPDTVRIATGKLETLLRQAEEMLALKLTGAQRLTELRQLQSILVQWEKEWRRNSPDLRSVAQKLERPASSSAARTTSGPASKVLEFLEGNQLAFRNATEHLGSLIRAAEHDGRTLGGMVDHLLADAKQLLMLPFSNLLAMFPKLVRDLCRDEGKQAELVMHGGEVEIDKRVLEELKDPLIHLVRNCIDHGLERPDVRTQQGKPAHGTLTAWISQVEGNKVEVLLRDDGQGIDPARVRAAAVAHGILSEAKSRQLSDGEAIALIFKSGFSTSPAITEISGRGLGMAIVREKVERLGGSVAVETHLGQGTAFRLLLPLTLATFRGIAIRACEQMFIIPTADVERVLRIPRAGVKAVENQDTIVVDGCAVALVRLDQLLELPPPSRAAAVEYLAVVVLGAKEQRIAFVVDEVLQEHEVLVKSLGRILARVRNVAGATVLGSGKPVVILNAADLLKSAAGGTGVAQPVAPAPLPATSAKQQSILVAEDSITARMLLKNILESAGFQVTTAVDGIDAWTALKSEPYDLVVSDIQMPRLNGFELTAKIRADKALAALPVILVTGLVSREDRERGIDVGANAYILKRDFDQSDLLEVIHRLI